VGIRGVFQNISFKGVQQLLRDTGRVGYGVVRRQVDSACQQTSPSILYSSPQFFYGLAIP